MIASAEPVWVIRFRTGPIYFDPPCHRVAWLDELLFHNSTAEEKVVRLVGTTPGTDPGTGLLALPPGRTVSTHVFTGIELGGSPFGPGISVNQLDIPEGVTIASRAAVIGPYLNPPCDFPASGNFNFGSLPLPIFRQLVPANRQQIHLGADLGAIEHRTNVILYNGGTEVATGTVEYRVACDQSLIERRTVSLLPNTVVQIAGFTDFPRSRCFEDLAKNTTRYVVVTMDQPGFSHVMSVSNEFATPTIGVTNTSGP